MLPASLFEAIYFTHDDISLYLPPTSSHIHVLLYLEYFKGLFSWEKSEKRRREKRKYGRKWCLVREE